MTTTTSISSVNSNAPQAQAPVAPPPSAAAASALKPLTQPSDSSISPRIVVDPSAGVIFQSLSSTGQIQNQIPSTTVVAYLRAGLTPQGLSKPQTTRA